MSLQWLFEANQTPQEGEVPPEPFPDRLLSSPHQFRRRQALAIPGHYFAKRLAVVGEQDRPLLPRDAATYIIARSAAPCDICDTPIRTVSTLFPWLECDVTA